MWIKNPNKKNNQKEFQIKTRRKCLKKNYINILIVLWYQQGSVYLQPFYDFLH